MAEAAAVEEEEAEKAAAEAAAVLEAGSRLSETSSPALLFLQPYET